MGEAHLSRRSDCESALGEMTISDEAVECGNRLIGTGCSAHLCNSPTNRMHMVSPKVGMTTGLWLPSATCPITKSQRDASGAADKDDRLRLSDPMCEACRLTRGDYGSSSMSLREHRTRPGTPCFQLLLEAWKA